VLYRGEVVVTGLDPRPDVLVVTETTETEPGRVVAIDRSTGSTRVLAAFPARFPVGRPERFAAVSADGTVVDAWLLRPAGLGAHDAGGDAPAARYPVLLNIHGGPYTQYGHNFFDEFQVQAAAGYAVLYSNPRGSSGYGEAWGQAIRGAKCTESPGTGWGSVDTEDVTAVVDTALARWSFLDPDRVGVLGGSYGGYLTSWLVGHTDRFRAACSERAVNNVLSMRHTSDIGWWFNVSYVGTDDADDLLACSPITFADAITTPLLIVHSEQDYRCPIEQAEDLFLRLRQRGQDVELVRFPGEGHELSRSGSPKHRVARFEIILEFFAKHLQR
jgi:dipeptidyl aminopeptidase/acylaminoacyl peptidase